MAKFLKSAFSSGVLSRKFHARSDLDKYSLGLSAAHNVVIDNAGSISTRPGMKFLDYIPTTNNHLRFYPFQFNKSIGNTYLLVFVEDWLYFVQDGAYVTFDPVGITSVAGAVGTIVAHGFVTGDWVKYLGTTYIVTVVSADTFSLTDLQSFPLSLSLVFTAGDALSLIYRLAHPYAAGDLHRLSFSQDKDVIYITHHDYRRKKLSRSAHTDWDFSNVTSASIASPASLTITPSAAATAGVAYAVTAVDGNGAESPLETISLTELSVNITVVAGSVKLTWPVVAEASYYKLYRSIFVPTGSEITLAQPLGYIGRAFGPQFVDTNITPDFSRLPPIADSTFIDGPITSITVTAPGAGYTKTSTITITDPTGSGFIGRPTVNGAGEVIAILILNPGHDYSLPVVSFSGGVGATAGAVAGDLSGNDPSVSVRLQQRRIYAGTDNLPMGVFASNVGLQDDFSVSSFPTPDEAFTLVLDSDQVTPIRYLAPFTEGMMAFTTGGIYLIIGSSENGFSADTAQSKLLAGTSIANVEPRVIDNEVLFVEDSYRSILSVRQSPQSGRLGIVSISDFVPDYFTDKNPVVHWTYEISNNNLLWVVRADGTMVCCTYVPEQNVFAWTDHATRGTVEDIATVREGSTDKTYLAVDRGGDYLYLEQFQDREIFTPEDAGKVDSYLESVLTYPDARITVSSALSESTIQANSPVFSAADVGKHWRGGNGRGTVTEFISASRIKVNIEIPVTVFDNETSNPARIASGDWSLTELFTSFSGLDHLNGQTVSIFADGGEFEDQAVTNGTITLSAPASYCLIGLPFSSYFITLPLADAQTILQDDIKSPKAITVVVNQTLSMQINSYTLKNRFYEPLTLPPSFLSGSFQQTLADEGTLDALIRIDFTGPFHGTFLGFVLETD